MCCTFFLNSIFRSLHKKNTKIFISMVLLNAHFTKFACNTIATHNLYEKLKMNN